MALKIERILDAQSAISSLLHSTKKSCIHIYYIIQTTLIHSSIKRETPALKPKNTI